MHFRHFSRDLLQYKRVWQREGTAESTSSELPAKLLDYFLRSNKSNINQAQLWAGLVIQAGNKTVGRASS